MRRGTPMTTMLASKMNVSRERICKVSARAEQLLNASLVYEHGIYIADYWRDRKAAHELVDADLAYWSRSGSHHLIANIGPDPNAPDWA